MFDLLIKFITDFICNFLANTLYFILKTPHIYLITFTGDTTLFYVSPIIGVCILFYKITGLAYYYNLLLGYKFKI